MHTICPRSSDPFYIVTYYIKWVTTFWTYSTMVPGVDASPARKGSRSAIFIYINNPAVFLSGGRGTTFPPLFKITYTLSENSNFTEKVAYEQKLKQYNVELERWQSNQEMQSSEACERLNACITFPGGWLIDQYEENDTDESRTLELEYLRKYWLPKVILLLHSVLHNTPD